MAYKLSDINAAALRDPVGFMQECDRDYQEKISRAASQICANLKKSPVVLLPPPPTGPSTTSPRR